MYKKCLGVPDHSSTKNPKPIIPCNRPVEDGEDWCKECGDKMMEGFKNCWADIAQLEAPKAKRSTIMKVLDRMFGKSK